MIDLFNINAWSNYNINEGPLSEYLNYIISILKLGDRKLYYFEDHHILPKSIDHTYSKDQDNLIRLTGEEHFQAHKLLLKCFNGVNKSKMYYSYNRMCNSLHSNHYNITPEDYEEFRAEFRKLCVQNNQGKNNPMYGKHFSEESKAKMSLAKKGKYNGENNPMYGADRHGINNPRFGSKQTDETKALIGNNSKGRIWVNDGIKNKFIKSDELESYVKLGFIYRGCLITGKNR